MTRQAAPIKYKAELGVLYHNLFTGVEYGEDSSACKKQPGMDGKRWRPGYGSPCCWSEGINVTRIRHTKIQVTDEVQHRSQQ